MFYQKNNIILMFYLTGGGNFAQFYLNIV